MPACLAYLCEKDDAEAQRVANSLGQFSALHFAGFETPDAYRDYERFMPFEIRPAAKLLAAKLKPGDYLLIPALSVFANRAEAMQELCRLADRGVGIVCSDTSAHVERQSESGQNALAIVRALRSITPAPRPREPVPHRDVPEDHAFIGWGTKWVHRGTHKELVWDEAMLFNLRLIGDMRTAGANFILVADWLNQIGRTHPQIMKAKPKLGKHRRGKKQVPWNFNAVRYGYQMWQRLENWKEQPCATSAMPESAPTNKPAAGSD